jgi:ATP-binding cassette subfamily F protein 3
MKKLDKIDRIEVDMEDVSKISIRFPEPPRAGKVIVTGEHIQKNYGDKKVISPMSFSIDRGDRIAFVGKNGMGKTTLSRIIAKDLDFEGDLNYGHNIHLGYFAQHQANKLNGENTILKEMESAAYGSDTFTQVRSILGAFLFSGEDVDKKVKVLSGGEKSRLSMAKLLLEPLNFLIFDEPTNHLDIVSKDVLKNAILNFDGTIIIVSHDRDFLKGLTNKIFEFTKEGIKQHLGDINEFLSKKNAENFRDFELSKEKKKEEKQAVEIKEQASPQKDKELKRIKNAIANAEKKIAELESQIQQMDQQLQNEVEFKKIGNNPAFFQRYDELKNQLESEMHKWEELLREADTPI